MGYAFPPKRPMFGVLLATVATAVTLGFGSSAAAQVSVGTEGGAISSDTSELVFTITNDSATVAITRIEIQLPEDTPIAEVYPMSLDNWAPSITMRTLPTPLPGIHGPKITDTPATVTYEPMPGQSLAPGATLKLKLSAGPIPDVKQLVFGVVQTNADGSVIRWTRRPGATGTAAADERPAPVLAVDAAPAQPGEAQPVEPPSTAADSAGGGTAWWVFAAFVLIGGLTVFGLVRQRRVIRQELAEDSPESNDDDSELAADSEGTVSAGVAEKA